MLQPKTYEGHSVYFWRQEWVSWACRDMPRGNIVEAALQLGEAEYVQLMADMEQSFLDDMLQDEAAFLSQLEAQDLDSLVSLSHPHKAVVSSHTAGPWGVRDGFSRGNWVQS